MEPDIRKSFGTRLRSLRVERGLTQESFARSIGMARTYYAEIESGKRNVSIVNIEKIARGLDLSLHDLFLF